MSLLRTHLSLEAGTLEDTGHAGIRPTIKFGMFSFNKTVFEAEAVILFRGFFLLNDNGVAYFEGFLVEEGWGKIITLLQRSF